MCHNNNNKKGYSLRSIEEDFRGKHVSVHFRKNNGEARKLHGRLGVHSDSEGTRYFLIWSVRERGFRKIDAKDVLQITFRGEVIYEHISDELLEVA